MSRREPAASPFRDLSNLLTSTPNPKPVPASPHFFTATKTPLQASTPTPLRRRRPGNGTPAPTRFGRHLRALEVDQSRSARRAEFGRERALRAFADSASSWLSLLLRDPAACGCSPAATGGGDRRGERRKEMTPTMVAALRDSLREVCSLEDVTERMEKYMSKDACEEVLVMMFQICKNIDDGRLKMKAHCPLATDLRLKEKATRIFMCYNPDWLRIGLYIVLGGDSLLQSGLGKRDKEFHFLKLILEKQMFSQIMTAKSSSHKKVVEGHHVQGYSESLGNIILKRIFLFVAALDRAKIESALPLEAGIDGLDGGSPLLFYHQGQVKSSRQIIQDSLGEAMHGEGDLLMHLTTMGYKLNYQQTALSEYDFTIRSLFEDLQDGIILCRVVQLLLSDSSIILKVIAPSDTSKKRLSNCTTAIQYIKQAQVPLSDSDGVTISAEDIAAGDKELSLSLLWNVFIHMQLPLLASTSLAHELTRLSVPVMSMEQRMSENKSHMGLIYDWVHVICSKSGITVGSSSQFDRRTLNCLMNYYLNIDIFPHKETQAGCREDLFTCHELGTSTDITSCPSSKMGQVLADIFQEIPASGILADGVLFDEKSAIILLAFLSSHLTNDEKLDQLKDLINMRLDHESPVTKISARHRSRGKNGVKYQPPKTDNKDGSYAIQEWAATVIQTQARSLIAKNKYCKLKKAIFILQGAMRAWSAVTLKSNHSCLTISASTPWQAHGTYNRYFIFIMERHRFVHMRKSATIIQQAVRIWIRGRKRLENNEPFKRYEFPEGKTPSKTSSIAPSPQEHCIGDNKTIASATPWQHCEHADTSQASAAHSLCFDGMYSLGSTTSPLSMFESNCKSTASSQLCEVETSNVISVSKLVSEDEMDCGSNISSQAFFEHGSLVSTRIDLPVRKESVAAQRIQSAYKESVAAQRIQSAYRRFLYNRNLRITAAIKIQSHWRCYSVRNSFTKQVRNIVGIQTSIRLSLHHRACQCHQLSAVLVQRFVRGWLARKRLLGSSSLQTYIILDQSQQRKCHQSLELKIVLHSVIKLQRWWRKFLLHQSVRTSVISIQSFVRGWLARKQLNRIFCCVNIIQRWWRKVLFLESRKRAVTVIQTHFRSWVAQQDAIRTRNCITTIQRWWRKVLFLQLRKRAVIVIQAHFRGWAARQTASRTRKSIIIIQSYVKAYLVRKASKQEVAHIRSRLQKSSALVDDSMRLINRLVAALSQLRHSRSTRSIRQTCTALSTATEYSKKCCETLVTDGAVDILLKQIHLLNRGIPDQEVLKQVFLTLRNIARYPHLRQVLVNIPESAEIIFQELLRNKAAVFFIASDILKKLCESKEGHETARALHHHIKRLRSLVQDLEKKVDLDKRNGRTGAVKENNLRQLREAATLYHLLTCDT
nr:abnormal spindle-like microcephaly-associated protein homolog isoform X1 [Setaria viridis]